MTHIYFKVSRSHRRIKFVAFMDIAHGMRVCKHTKEVTLDVFGFWILRASWTEHPGSLSRRDSVSTTLNQQKVLGCCSTSYRSFCIRVRFPCSVTRASVIALVRRPGAKTDGSRVNNKWCWNALSLFLLLLLLLSEMGCRTPTVVFRFVSTHSLTDGIQLNH